MFRGGRQRWRCRRLTQRYVRTLQLLWGRRSDGPPDKETNVDRTRSQSRHVCGGGTEPHGEEKVSTNTADEL